MFQAAVTAAVTIAMVQIIRNDANGNGHENGNGTGNSNQGDNQGIQRGCTYKDFTNRKPKIFNGSRGIIALTWWFEKTKSVFEICGYPEVSKVKFAACAFSDRPLSWWNGHVKALTLPVANSMTWEDLKNLILEEYCPRGEVHKLEQELWNLNMNGSNIEAYTSRFSDLEILCPGMITPESKKIERFIWVYLLRFKGM